MKFQKNSHGSNRFEPFTEELSINPVKEQDANLEEGYTSFQQASDEKKY